MKRWLPILLMVFMVFGLAACENETAPAADSDSQQEFKSGSKVPVDRGVYTITGTVQSPVESLVRQTQAAEGRYSGGGFFGSAFASGSYFGPEYGGKGFVRILVETSDVNLAPVGHVVILKSTDTKASILGHGDRVTFKCRKQYESLAAVVENERFDANTLATWELDYCRMVEPHVEIDALE